MNTVTIIGGGLAGLTLGIGLRRAGVPVVLWEAGQYPRHRVCGELISGRGPDVLASLGLLDRLMAGGARWGQTIAFFTSRAAVPVRPLPTPALLVSRFSLDDALARELVQAGGDLRAGQRWAGSFAASGLVRASGRRVHTPSDGPRWLGLKAHARGVETSADQEMHLLPNAYVGVGRLADETVNVCGLFRVLQPPRDLARNWREWLRGPADSRLRARLGSAEFVEGSFCSVAGFSLKPERASATLECRIGDALTMTPPITGNGMSMAFESAALAVAPLAAYSRGELPWDEARASVGQRCDAEFSKRLRSAAWLQAALMNPGARALLVGLVTRFSRLQQWLFQRTRCGTAKHFEH